MGGVRRQTHWDNAREQGLIAGANMTGKKRQRYEQIPYFWTEMFDLRMDFVGDFSANQPGSIFAGPTRRKNLPHAIIREKNFAPFCFVNKRRAKWNRPRRNCATHLASSQPAGGTWRFTCDL